MLLALALAMVMFGVGFGLSFMRCSNSPHPVIIPCIFGFFIMVITCAFNFYPK